METNSETAPDQAYAKIKCAAGAGQFASTHRETCTHTWSCVTPLMVQHALLEFNLVSRLRSEVLKSNPQCNIHAWNCVPRCWFSLRSVWEQSTVQHSSLEWHTAMSALSQKCVGAIHNALSILGMNMAHVLSMVLRSIPQCNIHSWNCIPRF